MIELKRIEDNPDESYEVWIDGEDSSMTVWNVDGDGLVLDPRNCEEFLLDANELRILANKLDELNQRKVWASRIQ